MPLLAAFIVITNIAIAFVIIATSVPITFSKIASSETYTGIISFAKCS